MLLGDAIEQALTEIGVTKDAVEKWLGPECGCDYRKEQLNLLDQWARRTLSKTLRFPRETLAKIVGETL